MTFRQRSRRAINYRLKPHLVRSALDSCRTDAIEQHSGYGPTSDAIEQHSGYGPTSDVKVLSK
jgi:hypothetical protein